MKTAEADMAKAEKKERYRTDRHPSPNRRIRPGLDCQFCLDRIRLRRGHGSTAHDERDHEFATQYGLTSSPSSNPHKTTNPMTSAKPHGLKNRTDHWGIRRTEAQRCLRSHWRSPDRKSRRRTRQTIDYGTGAWVVSVTGAARCPRFKADGSVEAVPADQPWWCCLSTPNLTDPAALKKDQDFIATTDSMGMPVERDTDTFDTFMNPVVLLLCLCRRQLMLAERAKHWLPIDLYIGGIEHVILHLLYARFYHKVMRDEGLVDRTSPSAFAHQGMVLARSFYRELDNGGKEWFNPVDVEQTESGYRLKSDGQPVIAGGHKMSKSKQWH